VYIDPGDAAQNKALFDRFLGCKSEIETTFGEQLEWERLDDRRACRVASYFPGSITASTEQLAAIREGLIDRLLRLKKAVGPSLKKDSGPLAVLDGVA